MEIDITSFFRNEDPSEFSASIAETGRNDIGKVTWRRAVEAGTDSPLLTTPDAIEALREYVKDFGAWDDEEIAAWSDAECNALFIQLVSGDIREGGLDQAGTDLHSPEWDEYEKRAEEGRCGGNIYRSGESVFYTLSR